MQLRCCGASFNVYLLVLSLLVTAPLCLYLARLRPQPVQGSTHVSALGPARLGVTSTVAGDRGVGGWFLAGSEATPPDEDLGNDAGTGPPSSSKSDVSLEDSSEGSGASEASYVLQAKWSAILTSLQKAENERSSSSTPDLAPGVMQDSVLARDGYRCPNCKITAQKLMPEDALRLYQLAHLVSRLLEHHRIWYMAAGGTLLGAVRNGGIIPHDDDVDFNILRLPGSKQVNSSGFRRDAARNGLYVKYVHRDFWHVGDALKPELHVDLMAMIEGPSAFVPTRLRLCLATVAGSLGTTAKGQYKAEIEVVCRRAVC
eukprot:TRINITY_DN15837_c0_g1_i1.p1 TRINITY_DN15837_c0_g1~~TRINITY_DN15837_c0_g1_i1.p1  ORF type:complete len:315 (-),score=38.49 TRINITY_DN15837_c0_g1_i1:621-1565(-)